MSMILGGLQDDLLIHGIALEEEDKIIYKTALQINNIFRVFEWVPSVIR